jgi:hypothetical protein
VSTSRNGWLKAIEATLSLFGHLVHNVMFEVGFYFQSLTTSSLVFFNTIANDVGANTFPLSL